MLKAGEYYVGELREALGQEVWCEIQQVVNSKKGTVFQIGDMPFGYLDVDYCGEYKDSGGTTFTVNCFHIGCVPIEFIKERDIYAHPDYSRGHVIQFNHPFTPSLTRHGVSFGPECVIEKALCECCLEEHCCGTLCYECSKCNCDC